MKEAVGSSLLLYIVIIVLGITGSIIVSTNSYSRAYKAKNSIINTIDTYYNFKRTSCLEEDTADSSMCFWEIDNALKKFGETGLDIDCDKYIEHYEELYNINGCDSHKCITLVFPDEDYPTNGACIYKIDDFDNNAYFYSIVTFNHLTIPIVGTLYKIPVYGETRTYYQTDWSGGNI